MMAVDDTLRRASLRCEICAWMAPKNVVLLGAAAMNPLLAARCRLAGISFECPQCGAKMTMGLHGAPKAEA